MAIETIYENQWVSLKKVVSPEHGVNSYYFSSETRCHGWIVALLPFRRTAKGREYLVKSEVVPCWGLSQVYCAITGGWEGGELIADAVRELEEECGYSVSPRALIPLGHSRGTKSTDTQYALYSVDLTDEKQSPHTGDGSQLEREALSIWLSAERLRTVVDPQVHLMFNRLQAIVP